MIPVPPPAPATKPNLLRQFITFRRGPWENLATVLIALGIVMLLQPIWLTLFTYSFITTLAGTIMFVVVSKFPE